MLKVDLGEELGNQVVERHCEPHSGSVRDSRPHPVDLDVLERRTNVVDARLARLDAVCERQAAARGQWLDRAGDGEMRIEEVARDRVRVPPLECECKLRQVTGDPPLSVGGALDALDVEECWH